MVKLDKYELAAIVNQFGLDGDHVDNPYHNQIHCKHVYDMGEKLLSSMGLEPSDEFIWAALFHDYNHSGGKTSDDENIQKAIVGVTKAATTLKQTIANFKPVDLSVIASMIECTKFTGVFPNEPKTIEEQCLRDADLMTVFAGTDTAVMLLNGLYEEMLIKNPSLTKQEFVTRNVEFLTNAKYYTEPARELVEKYLESTLSELEPLLLQT